MESSDDERAEYKNEEDLNFQHLQRYQKIDSFISNYLDDVLDLYYEFQERFSWSPFFLGRLKSTDLTDFLVDCIFIPRNIKSRITYTSLSLYEPFLQEYRQELHVSFTMIDKFLSCLKVQIKRPDWGLFCFHNSDWYEIQQLGSRFSFDLPASSNTIADTVDSH
jgi:hypothetical protein